jgi:hypothetical protein
MVVNLSHKNNKSPSQLRELLCRRVWGRRAIIHGKLPMESDVSIRTSSFDKQTM